MAAVLEQVSTLINEGKLEAAGRLAREEWSKILGIDSGQRETLLESCTPSEHSLLWIAMLTIEFQQSIIDWSIMVPRMLNFTTNFSVEQVHLHPVAFCDLIHSYTEALCVNRKAILGIGAVRNAVQRYSPTENTLTAIHSDLIQLCLAAKCIKPCLPYLANDYTAILTEKSQLDSKHVVLYFYYGGMAYTCLHDYLRALQLFTMCLCVPAIAVSAVMLAAYKKYILVSLLKYGKLISLPRCASHLVERVFKGPCGPYLELAKHYTAGDRRSLMQISVKFRESFISEGNYGLVQRVETQLVRHMVQRLTMTFLTLPLEDAAQRVELSSSKEIEKMLQDMIEDGDISATINHKEQMVVFSDDSIDDHYAGTLETRLQECISLQQELSKANDQLAVNPRYVQKSGGAGGTGLEDDPFVDDQLM